MRKASAFVAVAAAIALWMPVRAQQRPATPAEAQRTAAAPDDSLRPAPNRRADEGKGPTTRWSSAARRLVDGTGGPARSVDIVVSKNKITAVRVRGRRGWRCGQLRTTGRDFSRRDGTGACPALDLHVHWRRAEERRRGEA